MSEVAPVAEGRRIKSLDVMRGFAVLGILAVNAAYFSAPWQVAMNPASPPLAVTAATLWSWLVMHVFFELKCITLFSMLFGASLYMVGGEREDSARGAVLRRRLLWLFAFGLIHGLLIWYGDILFIYALTGFLVLFARSWPARALLTAGGVLFAASVVMGGVLGLMWDYVPAAKVEMIRREYWALPDDVIAEKIARYQAGVVSATSANIEGWLQFIQGGLFSLMLRTAGVMMIGMALFKAGFLSGNAPKWVYTLTLGIGAASLLAIGWQALLNAEADFDFLHMQVRGLWANALLSLFVAIGYASLFVLLVQAGARFVTEPLAAVGRMAFTNYIAQSLIMTTIFYGGRGFGLWGEADRVVLWGIVVAIWALQLIWSPLWLARFEMGPLEWAWRRLSYGRPLAIAKG
jgi:uncharacterized protein